ncbi:Zn(2)-Cys(6) binuclear cluster domain-containing protein [Mycena metata]|uniref:Zn(2)-Cys(6) binuclear cluster domain-containing protein n=1 Tax=Mycena metata TaxID=1033252 RepID=A0AAD7N6T9_9AGAR|nr:Zn(2)-Cys(6) binuclear cluster domain-containing protein [Mycena metata]
MSGNDEKSRPAKVRGQPLRRGKACLNCRFLKIKCDGIRPVCGQCKRVPKDDPCEFTDEMSRTMELENAVFRLQSRINDLEGMAGPSTYPGHPPSGSDFSWSSQLSGTSSPFSGSSAGSPRPGWENSFLGVEEPPLPMIQMLLDYFLPHATQFGFFLDLATFRESALLPLHFGNTLRPSPALLSVAYLWGVHLSLSQPLISSEPVFLRRAQQHVSTEITEATNSTQFLHTIQAQVLLSIYMFRNKRFLESEFHANGAATLALGYQLHKIRSARPSSPRLLAVPVMLEMYPNRPQSAVEEGERIRGFWAVACLQSSLNVALNSAANFSILEASSVDIDTPWPLEIADYAAGRLPPTFRGQETIKNFFVEDPPVFSPVSALYAKAAVLLHRASQLASRWTPTLQPQDAASYTSSASWLDGRIAQFWERLPPLYNFYTDPTTARTLIVTHAMTAAAAIKLHPSAFVNPEAQKKAVFAASAIIACLGDSNVGDFTMAHPIVGSLCILACRVLMDEIRRLRALRVARRQGHHGVTSPPDPEEVSLTTTLQEGITTMRMYAVGSPLIKYQLAKLQQQYESPY